MGELEELAQFLHIDQRTDLKTVALQHVLGMTGNKEGLAAISEVPVISGNILQLLNDKDPHIAQEAALALINISSDPSVAKTLLQSTHMTGLVKTLYEKIQDEECQIADAATMIFSNLTRDLVSCSAVWDSLQENNIEIERLVFLLCQEGYNKHGANLRYLATVLSNLSQLSAVRQKILDREQCIIQRFLPFTEYTGNIVKKGGIIGALRNCCFEQDAHDWLLSTDVDILPRLLLPLAGPSPDHLDDDEVENLPVELQYLDEDKKIEEDPDIRKMILEALTQLCSKRSAREILRKKNTYIILRELHKQARFEKDREVLLACENVIDILIKTEEEIAIENYHEVDVPEHLVQKFEQMDKFYLED
ncbi:protein HGH1 homolog [Eurytemora carolleeae]|uniref:protein HGH1 homolog n=1 Tax=Eurytemora carolleeae TaxID=1294199 RepID=UPI000C7652B4|nr:protein HGH1 homolog [Eurytemora carolleeae]|eukprot:XP_023346484.1 protein HGH1 homolog [Eurytemora affinis]